MPSYGRPTTSAGSRPSPTSCRQPTSAPRRACSPAEIPDLDKKGMHMSDNVLRVGIGGPVGTGKTALTEALVPLFIAAGRTPGVITNDIYTQEDAHHVRRELAGILDPE